jgi:deoxyribose-phosphate aldolase
VAHPTVATLTYEQVAKTIDHSLLRPELDLEFVRAGVELARRYGVASATVRPSDVLFAVELLDGSDVFVSTVVGFPHGSSATETKAFEAARAVELGAREIDMVLNIGRLRSGRADEVREEIAAVVAVAQARGAIVKVIFENCFLQDEHKEQLCRICGEVGADFVKTSTGYGSTGATDEDLKLMRRCSPPHVQVKAAGGVRSFETLMAVRAVGVTRVGATATKAILDDAKAKLGG